MSTVTRIWRMQASWQDHGNFCASQGRVTPNCGQASARKMADDFVTEVCRDNPGVTDVEVTVAPGDPSVVSHWSRDSSLGSFRRCVDNPPGDAGQARRNPADVFRTRLGRLAVVDDKVNKLATVREEQAVELVGRLIDRFGAPEQDVVANVAKTFLGRRVVLAEATVAALEVGDGFPSPRQVVNVYDAQRDRWAAELFWNISGHDETISEGNTQ